MKVTGDEKFSNLDRRRILKVIAAGATLALPGWALGKSSVWVPEDLTLTPQQTEGPFYPQPTIEQQMFSDTDLVRKLGKDAAAKGQQCIVEGVIKDRKGAPLEGSVVEIWQACASGRYNHIRDKENERPLDDNFQFWGRAVTGKDGKYSFKTIIPGKYPGRTARHIHYRVDADGFKRCSTQCFFSDFGDDNRKDGIYQRLDRKERDMVTVEFDKPVEADAKSSNSKPNEAQKKKTLWKGSFDLVLARK